MKIGAMVPQGWRMDLSGIPPKDQWNTILKASKDIEDLNYESVWVCMITFIQFHHQHKIQHLNVGH